mgnify:CR=1 FL=1
MMATNIATFRKTIAQFPGAVTIITTGSGAASPRPRSVRWPTIRPACWSASITRPAPAPRSPARAGSVQLLNTEDAGVAMGFAGAQGASGLEKFAAVADRSAAMASQG